MSKELEALEYGKWYPIIDYYENKDKYKLDWALVQFKETETGFMPLPCVAEYIKRDGVWITQSDRDRYLCEMCEPIAFMLWKPYEKEDLDEQLGIPLDIAFKALKEGIYVEEGKYPYTSFEKHSVRGIGLNGLNVINNICSFGDCDFTCYYKDYKKTWWLKSNKLE